MNAAFRWDEPEEKLYWYCVCSDCGWESELVLGRDDLTFSECPDCQSENLKDERTYA